MRIFNLAAGGRNIVQGLHIVGLNMTNGSRER